MCEAEAGAAPKQQSPRVRREKQGRGGKVVTVVHDLELTEAELKTLGKELRQACATGGTVKDGRIEIRGDHREKVVTLLQQKGFRARAAGG
jgi:translation initiation factor 1